MSTTMATQTNTKLPIFAFYCRLDPKSEDLVATPHGDTIVVGQEIKLDFETYINPRGKDTNRVSVKNLANELLGFLPFRELHRVFDANQADWVCRVVPSAVGFKDADRTFWAEVAIFCYAKEQAKIFEPFFDETVERIAQGQHPSLNLSEKTLGRLLAGNNIQHEMKPTKLPKLPRGEAYYKTKQTSTEKMILAASARKKGCYFGAAVVALVIIVTIVFIISKVVG